MSSIEEEEDEEKEEKEEEEEEEEEEGRFEPRSHLVVPFACLTKVVGLSHLKF